MKNHIRQMKNSSTFIKIFGVASVVALIFLVAGLPNLEFQPGQALIIQEKGLVFQPIKVHFYPTLLASICLSSMLLTIPALILLLIFSSEARKLFKRYIRVILLWLILFVGLRFYTILSGEETVVYELSSTPPSVPEVFNSFSSTEVESENAAGYTPPEMIDWLGYLIGFLSILALGIIAYILWEKNKPHEDDWEAITLKAITDISSGRLWEDAVIECYAKMNAAVSHRRKLDRELAMTPGEFSQLLVSTGLPSEPVIELTHLFEQARYGREGSRSGEAQRAIRCLTAINQALGGEN